MKCAIAYIPVLHKGYLDFLAQLKEKGVEKVYLVTDELLEAHEELDYLNRKDRLRAVPVEAMLTTLKSLGINVQPLTAKAITELQDQRSVIYTPREDIGKCVAEHYFSNNEILYVDIFLRWHRDNTGEEQAVQEHVTIALSEFQQKVLQDMVAESENAVDWWRQVGAALVKDGEVLFVTHNEHMPEREMPNILGDTRALFKRGININYVTSAHAEVVAIAEAAKRGIATEGAELYVTDFPCPYCARLIAKSGIKKLYFMHGYAVLEGDTFLKEEGVEVTRVALEK